MACMPSYTQRGETICDLTNENAAQFFMLKTFGFRRHSDLFPPKFSHSLSHYNVLVFNVFISNGNPPGNDEQAAF